MRAAAGALVLVALLAACSGAPKEQFYTLSDSAGSGSAPLPALEYGVAVGPVYVPDAVDRPQFVLRTQGAQVRIAEQVRWAEPLKEGIARAVATNLAHALNNARVSPRPYSEVGNADYRVIVDVQRFDSTLGESATLEVIWAVRRTKDGELQTGRVRLQERVSGGDYEALVAAHARALNAVSRDIADAIRALRQRDVAAAPATPKP
jgi:uncharacterized lipoprotein YmbA